MSERKTRSQTGLTPRKPYNPGFVETPAPKRRSRKSILPDDDSSARSRSATVQPIDEEERLKASTGSLQSANGHSTEHANGHSNGKISNGKIANGHVANGNVANGKTSHLNGHAKAAPEQAVDDYKIDHNPEFEFGGPLGVSAIMTGFPIIMYYMWIGATYYDGKPPLPAPGQSFTEFLKVMGNHVYEGAFPSAKAWAMYWVFFVVEAIFYLIMPGVYAKGKALPHMGGKQLPYYCSGQWSWYATLLIAFGLHYSGAFPLYILIDEFGPIMSVAILSGIGVSFIAYFSAILRGAQHRMTGSFVYDFFMGAELNPRMFGWLDFKMFFEVRIPWYILFLTSVATACRQYERYGYVSLPVVFVVMAHFLYANACSKGEELIVTSWDMYFEKWGFMLIFWNLAGVPFTYCHCTVYLANHAPSEYQWNDYVICALFPVYLFVYWVWDTCNSQKNVFRADERGRAIQRTSFPQLPYRAVKNPKSIPTSTGDSILCDGWYGKARKVHYACDAFFALSWGFVTGFKSPFPWFYPVFFTGMIIHRTLRDIRRCRAKYGEAWVEYEKRVPYLFIPYVV